MAFVNENYTLLPGSYLFSDVAKRVRSFQSAHPDAKILRLGIGDVTLPLAASTVEALHKASDEMGVTETFRGYGPEQGYAFLTDAIRKHEYAERGVLLDASEIFISDGAKSDTANFQELFDIDAVVAVPDPVYPVYVDSNVMAGRAGELVDGKWSKLVYLPCTKQNGFVPALPERRVDLIYLCFPNNPTGAVLTKSQLKAWVDYAKVNDCVIFFDAAYRAFISGDDIPRSIYEIEGAKDVAVEFGSYSKTAGFTGTRCSWLVVPQGVSAKKKNGERVSLRALWDRRHSTKFNGTPYIIQRAAESIYSPEGKAQTKAMIVHYMQNATLIRNTLAAMGYAVSGGIHAPYIWFKTPEPSSWAFFDRLLETCAIVGTPGAGFGPSGEGYFRLTAFASHEATHEAMERMKHM